MTLEEAIRYLGVQGDIGMNGRWAQIEGERCDYYVVKLCHSRGYFTWCDHPSDRIVEVHPDPFSAINAGLRRCAGAGDEPLESHG